MPELKRSVKDSVFTCLFRQPEYARQLYLSLHPEDASVTCGDLRLVTLERVLSTGLYNDLGLLVRERLLLLVEAQSTLSRSLPLRMLLYLASTYKEHVVQHGLDLYGGRAVPLPRPELWAVCTSPVRPLPRELSLSAHWGAPGAAEVTVRLLGPGEARGILEQYIRFCRVVDTQRRRLGRTQAAIDETLRQCARAHILEPFLIQRRGEVVQLLTALFDQERAVELHDRRIAKAASRAGRQKGFQAGREVGIRALVSALQELSLDREAAANALARQLDLPLPEARERVERYWSTGPAK